MIALSGVRSSCDMTARKSDLALLAASASRRATVSRTRLDARSPSARRRSWTIAASTRLVRVATPMNALRCVRLSTSVSRANGPAPRLVHHTASAEITTDAVAAPRCSKLYAAQMRSGNAT
jgi:hypothetical protein